MIKEQEEELTNGIPLSKEEVKVAPDSSSNLGDLFSLTRKEVQFLMRGEQDSGENQDSDSLQGNPEEE